MRSSRLKPPPVIIFKVKNLPNLTLHLLNLFEFNICRRGDVTGTVTEAAWGDGVLRLLATIRLRAMKHAAVRDGCRARTHAGSGYVRGVWEQDGAGYRGGEISAELCLASLSPSLSRSKMAPDGAPPPPPPIPLQRPLQRWAINPLLFMKIYSVAMQLLRPGPSSYWPQLVTCQGVVNMNFFFYIYI